MALSRFPCFPMGLSNSEDLSIMNDDHLARILPPNGIVAQSKLIVFVYFLLNVG